MINIRIIHVFASITCCGAADKTRDYGAVVLRSNPVPPSLSHLILTYWRGGRWRGGLVKYQNRSIKKMRKKNDRKELLRKSNWKTLASLAKIQKKVNRQRGS